MGLTSNLAIVPWKVTSCLFLSPKPKLLTFRASEATCQLKVFLLGTEELRTTSSLTENFIPRNETSRSFTFGGPQVAALPSQALQSLDGSCLLRLASAQLVRAGQYQVIPTIFEGERLLFPCALLLSCCNLIQKSLASIYQVNAHRAPSLRRAFPTSHLTSVHKGNEIIQQSTQKFKLRYWIQEHWILLIC
jgi:hypothetical protein